MANQQVETDTQNKKGKLELWVAIVSLITGLVGIIAAGVSLRTAWVQYSEKRVEMELKVKSENEARAARQKTISIEQDLRREQALREKLEQELSKDQASIRKFMENYRTHLERIRNAYSRFSDVKQGNEAAMKKAQDNLVQEVLAYVKFRDDWKHIHTNLAPLLNGDIDALATVVHTPRMTDVEVSQVSRRTAILENNFRSKEDALLEALRKLQQGAGTAR